MEVILGDSGLAFEFIKLMWSGAAAILRLQEV